MKNSVYKPAFYIGIIMMASGVILGALGAHALKPHLTESLADSYETAVRFQLFHGLALLIIGVLSLFSTSKLIKTTTWTFLIGILLFSGSIYALIYMRVNFDIGLGALGMLTPIGGLTLIVSWILMLPIIKTLYK